MKILEKQKQAKANAKRENLKVTITNDKAIAKDIKSSELSTILPTATTTLPTATTTTIMTGTTTTASTPISTTMTAIVKDTIAITTQTTSTTATTTITTTSMEVSSSLNQQIILNDPLPSSSTLEKSIISNTESVIKRNLTEINQKEKLIKKVLIKNASNLPNVEIKNISCDINEDNKNRLNEENISTNKKENDYSSMIETMNEKEKTIQNKDLESENNNKNDNKEKQIKKKCDLKKSLKKIESESESSLNSTKRKDLQQQQETKKLSDKSCENRKNNNGSSTSSSTSNNKSTLNKPKSKSKIQLLKKYENDLKNNR